MIDQQQQILQIYKADTTDLSRKLTALTAEERAHAQTVIDGAAKQSAAITKVSDSLRSQMTSVKGLQESFQAVIGPIMGIQGAILGAVHTFDLLKQAGKGIGEAFGQAHVEAQNFWAEMARAPQEGAFWEYVQATARENQFVKGRIAARATEAARLAEGDELALIRRGMKEFEEEERRAAENWIAAKRAADAARDAHLESLMAGATGGAGKVDDLLGEDSIRAEVDRDRFLRLRNEMMTTGAEVETILRTLAADLEALPPSLVKRVFGPLGQFDLARAALESLKSAATSAFAAWASGSLSAGAAFRQMLADMAKSLASEMFLQALKHGAYAIATWGTPASAHHAKAAAAFGAGAIAAGLIARAAVPSGGGSGSASGVSGISGGGSGSHTTQTTIYMGDSFSGDSPRMRSARLRRMLAEGGEGVRAA